MEDELEPAILKQINEGFDEIVKVIYSIQDEKLLKDFLECLLCEAERLDLSKRWLLVKELNSGTTQRQIAKQFKMSLCKITRGSKELKKENSAFQKVLDMIDGGELL